MSIKQINSFYKKNQNSETDNESLQLNELNKDLIYYSSEYTDFLEDLEEDPSIRQNVNVYKGRVKIMLYCGFINICPRN